MTERLFRILGLFVVIAIFSVPLSQAQQAGILTGILRDCGSDTVLQADVVVRICAQDSALVAMDTTDVDGAFVMEIDPGIYIGRFSKASFFETIRGDISVAAGETTSINVPLVVSGCPARLGDVNHNGGINCLDVVYALNYFKGGAPPPLACACPNGMWYAEGDVNGDCDFNGADISYFVNYFKGGPDLRQCPDCPIPRWGGRCGAGTCPFRKR